MRAIHTAVLTVGLLCSGLARAEGDWFASLYTGEGVELRADERVFTLYALLNAMGYDTAPLVRQHPVAKYRFHPVRQQVRAQLLAMDPELRTQADAFFDAHPQTLDRYLAYAVNSGPPPFAAGAKSKELSDLKGLEGLLAKVYASARLGELMVSVQGDYRAALKSYLAGLDEPLLRARKLLRLGDKGPESTLVVNLLDSHGSARGVLADSEIVLVVGPSDTANVEGALREFAQVVLAPKVGKKAQASWGGGPSTLREAQLYGATEQTVADYATALVSRALALKAMNAGEAAYDRAAKEGYFGLKDVAKGFDEGRPVEAWLMEALGKAETRRPAKK